MTDLSFSYPRPQLRRAQWVSLNGEWKFLFDDEGRFKHPEEIREWKQRINIPFAPESRLSKIEDTGFHSFLWYQRDFHLDWNSNSSDRLLLHFGAVDYRAKVWLNGIFLGEHLGGNSPFHFDVTEALRKNSSVQTLSVWAHDDPHDLGKPRGKQDWKLDPHSIWYPRTSGIWQTVWYEQVSSRYLDSIRWTPHLERWEIGFEAFVNCDPADKLQLNLTLISNDHVLVKDTYAVLAGEVHRRIALSDPGIDDYRNELLWSPEKPVLIQAKIEIWHQEKLVDSAESYTALRSVSVHRDRFMLNGRPYYLRMILDQGYWKDSLLTPPSDEAIKMDIQLVKQMGFNGVRKHQKIEDPRFLYWADVLGLMVWEEMPSSYRFTHDSVERLTREWIEILDRDMSHPCIVTWVPFNESWGVPDLAEKLSHQNCVRALYHLTKTLDPNRPVIGNDGWESVATDIIGIHDYDPSAKRMLERYGPSVKLEDLLQRRRPGGRILALEARHSGPLMLTEFGGIAFCLKTSEEKKKTWGYSRADTPEEFEKHLHRLLHAVQKIELFSGYCYTQLTDTFQEANGLLYANRQPKIPLAKIREAVILRDEEIEKF